MCVYVYPHATCDNDDSIHDTCYVLQFCLPLKLTAACYLQIDVCMNVQGTKRTLLRHAMPTLQCMPFHKDGI